MAGNPLDAVGILVAEGGTLVAEGGTHRNPVVAACRTAHSQEEAFGRRNPSWPVVGGSPGEASRRASPGPQQKGVGTQPLGAAAEVAPRKAGAVEAGHQTAVGAVHPP